jgi:S1-C subfamily serine protease
MDYHKPSDDWDKLNYTGISRIVDLLSKTVNKFGNMDQRPPFHKVTEVNPKAGGSGNRSGSKVWFGIVPNFNPDPKGLRISGASPGSPAEKAGFIADDILTSIDDKEVKNLHDFTFALREKNPGDEVMVKFLRNGAEKTCKVRLISKE